MPRLILLALVFLVVAPSAASAGTYEVHACRLPDGSPAPTRGWVPLGALEVSDPSAGARDDCAASRRFIASLPEGAASGDTAAWSFAAPRGTAIGGFRLYRVVQLVGGVNPYASYLSSLGSWPPDTPAAGQESCEIPLGCWALGVPTPEDDPSNVYERTGLDAQRLVLGVRCDSVSGARCNAPIGAHPAEMAIFGAHVTLLDPSAPQFEADPTITAGETNSNAVVHVVASDRGGGLAGFELSVDNQASQPPASPCPSPYVDPVPCPLESDLRLPIDISSLSDDTHELQVTAEDAGGNRTVSRGATFATRGGRLVPQPVEPSSVARAALPNGQGASRFARVVVRFDERSGRSVKTLRYGVATRAAGRLTTAAGTPIVGATVDVEERLVAVGSAARPLPGVRTGKDGRFVYSVKSGPSRVLRFSYKADSRDPAPVAADDVTLHVRAGVALQVSPTRVRNGTLIAFRGRVLGERGARRAIVTIYALANGPRKRIPVETVRAGSDGRFVYRYRFRSIPAPSTYRFEARVPKQTGFPYSEGASSVVVVRGRP